MSGAQLILDKLTPILENIVTKQTSQEVQLQEYMLTLSKIMEEIQAIKAMLETKPRKTIAKSKASDNTGEGGKSAEPVKFPSNKRIYFEKYFIEDEEFKARYMSNGMQAAIDANEKIPTLKTPDAQQKETAKTAWLYLKDNNATLLKTLDDEYKAAKAELTKQSQDQQDIE